MMAPDDRRQSRLTQLIISLSKLRANARSVRTASVTPRPVTALAEHPPEQIVGPNLRSIMTTLSIRGNPLLADHYSPAEGRYSVPSGFEAKKKGRALAR